MSLLAAKLQPPRLRTRLVTRPRLLSRLGLIPAQRVTLVSAPAGYGKTTLIRQWLAQAQVPAAWLALDAGDNDPARCFAYLAAAMQALHPGADEAASVQWWAVEPAKIEPLLVVWLNALANAPPGALVLDDYHVIENPALHSALVYVIDHAPATLHWLIATRSDPPLPLARWRARDELLEFRAADLALAGDEVTAFLNDVMALDLEPEAVAALAEKTEGWPAGLQLAALALQPGIGARKAESFARDFTGTQRFVLDYLADEVLDRQPADRQRFLLETAGLERLSGALCDAVTGRADSGVVLAELERANLFVSALDDQRQWYRYHALFADLLRRRQAALGPAALDTLNARASAWWERHGSVAEALRHALAAGDFDRAARLVRASALGLLDQGELSVLARLIAAVPEPMRAARPWLRMVEAWLAAYQGRLPTVEHLLRGIEAALPEVGDQAEADHLAGQAAAVRASLGGFTGDAASTIRWARQGLALLPATDGLTRALTGKHLAYALQLNDALNEAEATLDEAALAAHAAGFSHVRLEVLGEQAHLAVERGQLRRAEALCREGLQLAEANAAPLPGVTTAHAHLSVVLLEWNRCAEAELHAQQALVLARGWGSVDAIITGHLQLARARQARGNAAGALAASAEAIRWAHRLSAAYVTYAEAMQAWLQLLDGDTAAAGRWADRSRLNPADAASTRLKFQYGVLARCRVAQGRAAEVIPMLDRLVEACRRAGATGRQISLLGVLAVAQQSVGEREPALTTLAQLLALAEPEGHARTFVNEGPGMQQLLRRAASRGVAPDYARRLLALFAPRTHPAQPGYAIALVEPLSERELEVLRLVAAGQPNKVIAATLTITVETVKKHLKNVYGKLNAHSRTEALARARDVGVL